jgi:hypothetical protein
MKKYAFAILIFGISSAAFADGDFTKTGTMKIDAASERAAMLHIGCSSDRDGVRSSSNSSFPTHTRKRISTTTISKDPTRTPVRSVISNG